MNTTKLQLIIPNVEAQDDETGLTRGWIVPAGTDPTSDLELEAVAHVDIPATEDEPAWWQGLRDALAREGYGLTGPVQQDGTVVTAQVEAA